MGRRSSRPRRILSPFEIVTIVVASTAGAIVHGSVGIGLTLVAGPALVAIDASFAPGPLLVAGQLVGCRHIVAERQHLDRGAYRHCLLGLPVGLVVGLALLELLDDRAMALIIGSLTATAAAAILGGLSGHRATTSEVGAGLFCALCSVTAGLPGPPLVIAFADMIPPVLRATSAAVFMSVAVVAFFGLVATGNFGAEEVRLTLWLVPGILGGIVAARWVRPHVDHAWFRPAVLCVAFAGGSALVIRQLV